MSLGERSIAEEVIRFAEHAMHQNWIGRDRLKISFFGYVQAHRLDRISCDRIATSAYERADPLPDIRGEHVYFDGPVACLNASLVRRLGDRRVKIYPALSQGGTDWQSVPR